jgi:predicted dinucleotide-binding enzyme
MRIGVIGAGSLGGTVGRLWVRAGHEVLFPSRHPDKIVVDACNLSSGCDNALAREAQANGVAQTSTKTCREPGWYVPSAPSMPWPSTPRPSDRAASWAFPSPGTMARPFGVAARLVRDAGCELVVGNLAASASF